MSHPLVELARQTLQETIVHHRPFSAPADVVQQFPTPAAVFVTLWTADGVARLYWIGCPRHRVTGGRSGGRQCGGGHAIHAFGR
ncbi:MAG: hypothetical protein IPO15_17110 [Anaerolineae bacterium]|uniref:hypothetical protein n=1 Tax=Candidatus Amarolinea dominans TaxID=3140696 RepID=UPI0031348CF5|nr:hypothetical protein [Anaerolineae bacterium]